jgi:hypothetical protein
VQQHLIQQNLTCVFHAKGDHSQTVPDKYHVHTGVFGNVGTWEVVRGDHGYWFIPPVKRLKGVDSDRLAGTGRR